MGKSRSEQMASIRSRDTSPERVLRRSLWRAGLRYRIHYKTPAGRPDVVLIRPKVAVFVDGCQWHGCPEHYVRPRTNSTFWRDKLRVNVVRDIKQTAALKQSGWKVLRFWEHDVFENLNDVVQRVVSSALEREDVPKDAWRVIAVEILDDLGTLERRHLISMDEPPKECSVVRPRTTSKWKRPKSAMEQSK